MNRRKFITLVGGTAAAWPAVVRGQQPTKPRVVGFISSRSYAEFETAVAAFRRSLTEAGFVEGQNLVIEFRWAEGQLEQLPGMAADLVRHSVKVIFAGGGNDPVRAAAAATSSIPIVFTTSTDPVESGLVKSLNRPGGNITGVSLVGAALESKRFGVLKELVPGAKLVGVMVNPKYAAASSQIRDLTNGAATLNQKIVLLQASSEDEIHAAFVKLAEARVEALMVATDVFFLNRRALLVALAARYGIPTMYTFREYVQSGGLMSYGPSLPKAYRQAGIYVAQILKGAHPADLPIHQPTEFDLVLNSGTAKALNVRFPDQLLAIANEVIE